MTRSQASKAASVVVRKGSWWVRLPGPIQQLQALLHQNTFWATGRTTRQLWRMLDGSSAVVTAWKGGRLVGFGRASSDGIFRAVLWDVVVATDTQGDGVGRRLVEALLRCKPVASSEKVYVMTTKSGGFYEKLGFCATGNQQLLLLNPSNKQSG